MEEVQIKKWMFFYFSTRYTLSQIIITIIIKSQNVVLTTPSIYQSSSLIILVLDKETQKDQRQDLGIMVVPTKIDDHSAKEEIRMQRSLEYENKQGLGIKFIPTKVNEEGWLETKTMHSHRDERDHAKAREAKHWRRTDGGRLDQEGRKSSKRQTQSDRERLEGAKARIWVTNELGTILWAWDKSPPRRMSTYVLALFSHKEFYFRVVTLFFGRSHIQAYVHLVPHIKCCLLVYD